MVWSCNKTCCIPLKCTQLQYVNENKSQQQSDEVNPNKLVSMFNLMKIKNKNNKEQKPINNNNIQLTNTKKTKKIENKIIWVYKKDIESLVPIQCNEINL